MALLKCDICDGSLTMEVDGESAKCDVCGMKHTKERLRVKLKEADGDSSDNSSSSF